MENVMMRYLDEKDKIIKNLEEKVIILEEQNAYKKNYNDLFYFTINKMLKDNNYYFKNITIDENKNVIKDNYYKNLSGELEKIGIKDYDFIEELIYNAFIIIEKGESNE